jgi:hypothetical protein
VLSGTAHGEIFESSQRGVTLIELYTSEGCSSCPPADDWLSSLADAKGLWTQFVPVAFHVTYWDYLGWGDRFARASFDARHRQRAADAGAGVYTPGVFARGQEWRNWRRASGAFASLPADPIGALRAEVTESGVRVRFAGAATIGQPHVTVAWLRGDQQTRVQRGENAGTTLRHRFIADTVQTQPLALQDGAWQASVAGADRTSVTYAAVAVWVTDAGGQPIQATGGWLHSVVP